MMTFLAIDTSLERCSVAIRHCGPRASEICLSEDIGKGHAELLPDMLSDAFAESGSSPGDIDRIGVVNGPGSFTGMRVGLAMARGMALVHQTALIGIPTLKALAEAAGDPDDDRPIVAVQDARRSELFVQVFDSLGNEVGPAQATTLAGLDSLLPEAAILTGSGAAQVRDIYGSARDLTVACGRGAPDIGAVLSLTAKAVEPFTAPEPIYLRGPDAKRQVGFTVAHA